MKHHWYFIHIDSCPVCGREDVYRERRYGRRPKRYDKRHSFDWMAYDHCLERGWL